MVNCKSSATQFNASKLSNNNNVDIQMVKFNSRVELPNDLMQAPEYSNINYIPNSYFTDEQIKIIHNIEKIIIESDTSVGLSKELRIAIIRQAMYQLGVPYTSLYYNEKGSDDPGF